MTGEYSWLCPWEGSSLIRGRTVYSKPFLEEQELSLNFKRAMQNPWYMGLE